MDRITRIVILCILFVVAPFGQKTYAVAVSFNFNSAAYPGSAADIETYMEGIYGSDITVSGSTLHVAQKSAGERYIYGTNFSISFNNVSITDVSFNWSVPLMGEMPPFSCTYSAYADNVVFFSKECTLGDSGSSGTISFAAPVKTLRFSLTSFFGASAGVDNLAVTPVPEPTTAILLAVGAIITFAKRKNQRIICTEAVK